MCKFSSNVLELCLTFFLLFRYHFLTVECKAFLAPLECHSIYFCKQIVRGEKKFVKCDKVCYLSVPQYKGLGIAQFLE